MKVKTIFFCLLVTLLLASIVNAGSVSRAMKNPEYYKMSVQEKAEASMKAQKETNVKQRLMKLKKSTAPKVYETVTASTRLTQAAGMIAPEKTKLNYEEYIKGLKSSIYKRQTQKYQKLSEAGERAQRGVKYAKTYNKYALSERYSG